MANVRTGNTIYIDSTGVVSIEKNLNIVAVILTATAASGRIVIQDNASTPQTKMDLRVATSGSSQVFPLVDSEVSLANGLRIGTLTNAVATIILTSKGG